MVRNVNFLENFEYVLNGWSRSNNCSTNKTEKCMVNQRCTYKTVKGQRLSSETNTQPFRKSTGVQIHFGHVCDIMKTQSQCIYEPVNRLCSRFFAKIVHCD